MAPYVRGSRIETSSDELNRAELLWWEKYSGLIERIWALPDKLCAQTRQDYIQDIKEVFHRTIGKKKIRILEIACGSGWAGRLLADKETHVTGLDFSEEQVKMAADKAASASCRHCDYVRGDVNDLPKFLETRKFDGYFIHCGIHHLTVEELKRFAQSLAVLERGAVMVLVEPTYHDRTSRLTRPLELGLKAFYKSFFALVLRREQQDQKISSDINGMLAESAAKGWWLSPKEMPFSLSEITKLFADHFEIRDIKPVTHFGLRFGQDLGSLNDQQRADTLARRWFPLFNAVDRALISTALLPKGVKEYLFTRIVLVRK